MEQTQYIGYGPNKAETLPTEVRKKNSAPQKPITEKETDMVSSEVDFPTRRALESQNEGDHGTYQTKHGAGSFYTTDPYEIEEGVDRAIGPMDPDA